MDVSVREQVAKKRTCQRHNYGILHDHCPAMMNCDYADRAGTVFGVDLTVSSLPVGLFEWFVLLLLLLLLILLLLLLLLTVNTFLNSEMPPESNTPFTFCHLLILRLSTRRLLASSTAMTVFTISRIEYP